MKKDTSLFIVNSDNQELIHHIHCLGYAFYHQSKTKKYREFHKFLFSGLFFESYSSNVWNIYCSTKLLFIHYGLFLQQHFYSHSLFLFLFSLLPFTKKNTFLPSVCQTLQLQHHRFYFFILPMTKLLELS